MAIRRTAAAPDPSSYTDDEEEFVERKPAAKPVQDEDVTEEADEDELPNRSSLVQRGWKQARTTLAEGFTSDFRFTEDDQLIAFLSVDPYSYKQHFLNAKTEGRKSFVCLGHGCPLCRILGDQPSKKYAFSILNLSEEEPKVQLMVVGTKLCADLDKKNSDARLGPLDKGLWSVSRSGSGFQTAYSVLPVKLRDVAEDWDLDPEVVSSAIREAEALTADAIRISSKAELTEIARSIAE